ncbi:HYR domain-containing protein, partial [Candidatus Poribacteria bacterium]|nr:HYR domain-containing protein [Candidatus Poribacteria bacterium]
MPVSHDTNQEGMAGVLNRSFAALLLLFTALCASGSAGPVLEIKPVTWDVIGLDSNNVNSGPNRYPVGVRVSNTGDASATNLSVAFTAEAPVNSYISILPAAPISHASLSAGDYQDFFFEATITRTSAAYDTTQPYHITVTADAPANSPSTPANRELYVEKLVSQNRNDILSITGATTAYVGDTLLYELYSTTAPGGYEQLSNFINFPSSMFQVMDVQQCYSAPALASGCNPFATGYTNDKVYADACGWENDTTSANIRSCVGPANIPGGKAGGDMYTLFTVKIIGTGVATLASAGYDFSGSSYHYNADFGSNVLVVTVLATPGTITGHMFSDTNGNGIQSGEPNLSGVQVRITASDGSVQTVTTNASGNYSAIVPPGSTIADVIEASLPGGSNLTTAAGTDYQTVVVVTGASTATSTVGYQQSATPTGSLSVSKTSNAASFNDPGDTATFTITVTATGVQNNVSVSDTLPDGLTAVPGSTVVSGPSITTNVQDNFDPGTTYSENDGTVNWLGDWAETGDDGVVGTGDILITTDSTPGTSPPTGNKLRIGQTSNELKRSANLGSASSATLSFKYRRVSMITNCDLIVEVSGDGTTFLTGAGEFLKIDGVGATPTDTNYISANLTIPAAARTSNFALRFRTSSSASWGDTRFCYVDDVKISYPTTISGNDPPNLVTSSQGVSLANGESLTVTFNATIDQPQPDGVTALTNSATAAASNANPATGNYSTNFGSISGHVFNDFDGNGSQGGGETDRPNVTINLISGGPDNNLATTGDNITHTSELTDSAGDFTLSGLMPGSYRVSIDSTSIPDGATVTTTHPRDITIAAMGSTSTGNTFGIRQPGAIEGRVFDDYDGDGTQDSGEPGIINVSVNITDSTGTGGNLTDSSGNYSSSVAAGSDTVDVDEAFLPGGYVLTTGLPGGNSTQVIAVTAGATSNASAIGYQFQGTISGTVFQDFDGDGTQDPGEPGIPNITVTITDGIGLTHVTSTDSNGQYTVPSLPVGASGSATVDVDQNDPQMPSGAFLTTTDPASTTIVGGSTVNVPTGYQRRGTLTGHLFSDLDADGIEDGGEPGLANVTVTITPAYGSAFTVTTDSNGNYSTSVLADLTDADVDNADPDLPSNFIITTGTDPQLDIPVPAAGTANAASIGFCADPDNDGLCNADDNCDNTPNPGQQDCDGDGIGDACDLTDSSPPVISSCPSNQSTNADADCSVPVPDFTAGVVASDSCDPSLTVTQSPPAATMVGAGIHTVTLTVTDDGGNTATCARTFTVSDVTPPTISAQGNVVVPADPGSCSATGVALGSPIVSDNCAGVSSSNDAPGSFPLGTTTVTHTATDASGNTATSTHTVTVQDTQAPAANCQNVTVAIDGSGNASITAAQVDNISTDNCSITSRTVNPSTFTAANLGANSVVLTIADAAGNTATCTATVTVRDTTNPTAIAQDVTVYLDGTGNASVTAAQVNNGSSDNSGTVNLDVNPFAFTAANLGPNPVTLTATDGSGNSATDTATVTVLDNTPPTGIAQ